MIDSPNLELGANRASPLSVSSDHRDMAQVIAQVQYSAHRPLVVSRLPQLLPIAKCSDDSSLKASCTSANQ